MRKQILKLQCIVLLIYVSFGFGQENPSKVENLLTFEEYIGFVKTQHPLAKQAALKLTEGEATLLKARGGFDPKIEIDYDRKKFKGTEYYDRLNTTFKIPTYYGIELKANFEENTGAFLDNSQTVPQDGLYSAGISFSLAQGLLINQRMADLKKARFYVQQTVAERNLLVNNLIFEASKAYFDWVEASSEQAIYTNFLENAVIRLKAISQSVALGDKATIDSVEAGITVQTRKLELEVALLKKQKAKLAVSNYLWLDGIPLEIEENIDPKIPKIEILKNVLALDGITDSSLLMENHPKLNNLQAKIEALQVDRNLKLNKLLPKVDLEYNFLSQNYDQFENFNTANYKTYVNVSVPLFLRKERGDLKLADFKLNDATFERDATRLELKNKVVAIQQEIISLERQIDLINNIVNDYEKLVYAEKRKFELGESSLFLINSREQKLIDSQLKENSIYIKNLNAIANLFNALGKND